MGIDHRTPARLVLGAAVLAGGAALLGGPTFAGPEPEKGIVFPADATEGFRRTITGLAEAKPRVMAAAKAVLERRYDLSGRTDPEAKMSGGKPLPVGPTVRLPAGVTLEQIARMTPAETKQRGLFPYLPLPHPLEPDGGGMVFPASQVKTHPELVRVDVDFDIPDAYLPEFPPPLFLTTQPGLGDVSKGREITLDNYYALLRDVLTPFQLDGLRLLVTTFPQQQFNQTEDRATVASSAGVSCFSCHVNGHTTGQFHRVPDVRPHKDRPRIETVTLRGVFAQRTFGSKRNLRSIEDFTEVENNSAYFDGDTVAAELKGARHFSRREVAAMAAFQNIVDFPPAPKLLPGGDLDAAKATPSELRGQGVFRGKGRCVACHPGPYLTDNASHDLQVERFYEGRAEGIVKTFPLRGVKDSPPYLHDGRCPTLEDTVEFFDLVLGLRLSAEEKRDLVAYMRAL